MLHLSRLKKNPAFTLIELLVVIAIIAILIALLLPAVQKVRESAARTQTINCLKQHGIALHASNDALRRLPPAYGSYGSINPASGVAAAQQMASIHVHLMPYMEQDNVYKTWLPPSAAPVTNAIIPPFISPSDPSNTNPTGVQNYAANIRIFAPRPPAGAVAVVNQSPDQLGWSAAIPLVNPTTSPSDSVASIPKTFQDGTSNTIVFATRYATCGTANVGGSDYYDPPGAKSASSGYTGAFFGAPVAPAGPTSQLGTTQIFQLAPTVANCDATVAAGPPQSFSTGGIQVGLADGTVRTVAPSITHTTWMEAITANDGKVLGSDWD